jgi:hypothetical protein
MTFGPRVGRSNIALKAIVIIILAIFVCCCAWPSDVQPTPDEGHGYVILTTIPTKTDGIWDYATFDQKLGRLYLAQDGITVLDVRTGRVSSILAQEARRRSVASVHAVVPIGSGDTVAYSESGPIRVLGCKLGPGGIDVSVGRWAVRTKSVRCS